MHEHFVFSRTGLLSLLWIWRPAAIILSRSGTQTETAVYSLDDSLQPYFKVATIEKDSPAQQLLDEVCEAGLHREPPSMEAPLTYARGRWELRRSSTFLSRVVQPMAGERVFSALSLP
jgi:hypothetical protein